MRLRPFFGYFGSKWKLASKYPEPMYRTIIEPFAGSAGYALYHHFGHDVILCDANETVADMWDMLIHSDPSVIESIPDDPRADVSHLTETQRALMGFWFAKAPVAPRKTISPWAEKYPGSSWWGRKIKDRIIEQMPYISTWSIVKGDYRELDNIEATWYIDPPYQHHGNMYPKGAKGFDFKALGEWCQSRKGQIIVCEGEGADWLPFRPFHDGKRSTGQNSGVGPSEVIWTNEGDSD